MTQEKKVQTAAVMDVTGVERAAQDAVRAVRTMADGITREGEKAGKGMDAIGDGAERAERTIDAKTKSMGDRLRRLTQQAQRELAGLAASSVGGAGSAGAVEYEAMLRGADVAKLQPKIAALRDLQTQANALAESMRQAMVGEEFVSSINQRVNALQRQASALKSSEADLLALRAAELGVTQQADPLIAKLRATATALNEVQAASRKTAAADSFLTGLNAQANAIGKTRGDLLELKAAELGVSDKAAAMIAAIRAADGELLGMGKNAKLTANALRLVPAQFTDIVVSLQAGQNPMQVFLQQGGQLKDMFGGAGAAARALSTYVLGLVNPYTLAAAAAVGLGLAYNSGANEAQAFQRTVTLSGQVAGVTAGQLTDMAAAIRAMGVGTQGRAAEVLNSIADSADIGAGNLQRFVAAALQLEKAGGPSAEKTAEAFRSLAKDPLAAALKLNEGTNFLTRSVYEQIRALELQGRTVDAAKLAQEAYFLSVEERAPRVAQSLGLIERAWREIKRVASEQVDGLKGIGRELGTEQVINALRNRIASVQAGNEGSQGRDLLPQLKAELLAMQQGAKFEAQSAYYAAQRAASVKASAAWDAESDKFLTKRAQMEREIARTEQLGLAAGRSRADVEALVLKIREKYAEKADKPGKAPTYKAEADAAKEYARAIDSLQAIQLQATAGAEGLSKTQAKLRDLQADPAWATYSRQQREQIITQAAVAQSAEDQAAAVRAAGKAAADAAKDYAQWVDALQRNGDAVERQVQALQLEEKAARIAATGRLSLKAAIEEVTITRLRDAQVAAMGNPDAVLALQREIDAREKLRGLITGQEQRKAADDTAKEWARSAEKIGDSITDALMRGFESGKGFAESLRDTVVNMFKTMVLRPIISAIVSPIGGAISGAIGSALGMGATGAAAAGLSAGTGLSTLGGIAGLGGLASGFGAFGSGVASGLTAWGAGGSVTGLLGSGSALFAGGAANGLGVLAGALGPVALGLGALAALAKSLDDSGTPHYGASSAFSAATGLQLGDGVAGLGSRRGAYSANVEAMTTQITQTVVGVLDATALAFGQKAGFSAAAAFADDSSDDPAQGAFTIMRNGQLVAGNASAYQRYADGTKGKELYLAAVAGDVRTALNAIGLPDWATGLLNELGDAPTLEELAGVVAQIGATQQALVGLGRSLPQITSLSGAAVNALVEAFGGIEAMTQAAGTYISTFYSDAERAAIGAKQLRDELGKLGVADLPATREAYRALVEAQDLSTESGRSLYAALVTLAPVFGQVTEAVAQANTAIEAEITRLRGGDGKAASQAEIQARFAVATAQARAGDAKARESLPALSQAMEEAARQTAGTATDLARVRAWLANSLSETIGGTAAPGATPSSFTGAGLASAPSSTADTQTAQQLAALTERIGLLEEPLRASALSSARTARLLDRVIPDGDALAVRITT